MTCAMYIHVELLRPGSSALLSFFRSHADWSSVTIVDGIEALLRFPAFKGPGR